MPPFEYFSLLFRRRLLHLVKSLRKPRDTYEIFDANMSDFLALLQNSICRVSEKSAKTYMSQRGRIRHIRQKYQKEKGEREDLPEAGLNATPILPLKMPFPKPTIPSSFAPLTG